MGCCRKNDPEIFPSGNAVNSSRTHGGNHIDEKAPCCCCCACWPGGCTKRAATLAYGVIGLILAVSIIVPPIYIYYTEGGKEADYTRLFPMLKYGRQYLEQITDDQFKDESPISISTSNVENNHSIESAKNTPDNNNIANITPRQAYRLAIFQLLDDTEDMAPCMAFFSFLMGCANVPLNIFLIAGACCRKSCLIMPWIVITLLEHLIVGVPLIIFMGLISLYLAAQLHLYIQAACLMGFIITLFFLSMSSWFAVYTCYQLFNEDRYNYRSGDGTNGGSYDYGADCQSTQPLMNAADQPPPLPDGHPHFNGQPGYPIGGHPQVSYSNQYPSAPPPSGMYPSLNA